LQFAVPFIVKPADNSGSRGIYLVNDPSDDAEIEAAYAHCRPHSRAGDVVVEEYMRGPEVSVETLTIDGICHVIQITDKLTTGAPHFVEMGHSQPTRLSQETADRIREVAIAANRAIGITFGPSHTEIIVTDEGPKVVELGARLGGDCITTHLVPLSTGIDMVECCIRVALGEQPNIAPKHQKGSAIRYFSQTPGTIRAIEGEDDAKAVNGVRQIEFVHSIGDTITAVTDSASRMGFVIAQGDSADTAVTICEKALDKIHIAIET
jgi:biotin carboxylase